MPASAPPEPSPTERRIKSPPGAALLAAIPFGLGHLYLGLYERALLFFGAFWFSVWIEVPPLAFFFYFFAIIDAYRQAQLINTRETAEEAPAAAPDRVRGALALGVFLLVAGAILLAERWLDLDVIYWLRDWWPAALVIAGIYFIGAALHERAQRRRERFDEGLGEE